MKCDVDVVLKAVDLHLFGEEDELNRVNAHPRHVGVQILQLLEFILVTVEDVPDDAVEIGSN